ncbi:hypothetical protein [Vibrio phage PhiImVa-1]|nr:hypothetical protein [Vibrio phage PhiImVa-1]
MGSPYGLPFWIVRLMKRQVTVEKVSEQVVRITLTTGSSGRFIDVGIDEAEDILQFLSEILNEN